jgi:prepilin-type N-terminal cleavage/methylation domain-containing protein
MHDKRTAGFSLVEVLVAMVLVAGAVAGLASLGFLGLTRGDSVHRAGQALALAQGKLDELRAAPWGFDATGTRVTDTALALSPPLTLTGGGAPAVELFDRFAHPTGTLADAAFERRWAVTLVDAADPDTLLIQACVAALGGVDAGNSRRCVVTVRSRHP